MELPPSPTAEDPRLNSGRTAVYGNNPYEDDLEPPVLPGSDNEDIPGTHLR